MGNYIMVLLLMVSLVLNILLIRRLFKRLYFQYYLRKPFITFKYERDQLFETLEQHPTDIIFLGDSIIQHFELFEYLRDARLRNRGIGGDSTQGGVQRARHISKGNPSKCFIHLGINDVLKQVAPSEIVDNYRAMIDIFKKNTPKTKLYIHSILPISKVKEELIAIKGVNDIIFLINEQLKTLCKTEQLTYVDFEGHLFSESGLKGALTIDGLHLNGTGYSIMANKLKPFFNDGDGIFEPTCIE